MIYCVVFAFNLFDSIFLPNWYSIFTFNFDNVLTTILSKHKGKKYPVFNYPVHTMGNDYNCILHLHGLMNEKTTLEDIVFTSTSYAKLGGEQHSLYNVIYGDVETNKKNLIILGTQFNEQIVFAKFFKGLKRKDIKIYHFDLVNVNVAEKPEFKKRDYQFVKINDTSEFLQNNKDKIENIHIKGTEVINSTFIKKIKEGKQFSKTDFCI